MSESKNDEEVKKKTKPAVVTYSIQELMSVAHAKFGVEPEVVGAAMKMARKDKATVSDAKVIIDKFLKQGVK